MLSQTNTLDFVWLELTNRCNLSCTHCYANSGPHAGDDDTLTVTDYENVLAGAAERGCRAVQFIGGEPTLNKDLPRLISKARALNYDAVEVYSNLFSISPSLWRVFLDNNASVATSFYSADPAVFDRITTRAGSFARVIANIDKAVALGLVLRVGVIVFDDTKDDLEQTLAFLRARGVTNTNVDHLRSFGRGAQQQQSEMKNLCGKCAGNILVVGPNGVVAPCIMSKAWSVGDLGRQSLDDILSGSALAETRLRIAEATASANQASECSPNDCQPYFNCSPNTQCSPCAPNGGNKCIPNHNCNPGQVNGRASVKPGDMIGPGQVIAKMGSSGRSSGRTCTSRPSPHRLLSASTTL